MLVKEFIEKYNDLNNAVLKKNMLDGIILKDKYVPFTQKVAIATNIVRISSRKAVSLDKIRYKNDVIYQDSNTRMMLYNLHLINLYTDIDIDFESTDPEWTIVKQFESLDELDLIRELIERVSDYELAKFQQIMEHAIADGADNDNNLINFLNAKFDAINLTINSILDGLGEVTQNFNANDMRDLMQWLSETDNSDGEPADVVPFPGGDVN